METTPRTDSSPATIPTELPLALTVACTAVAGVIAAGEVQDELFLVGCLIAGAVLFLTWAIVWKRGRGW